MSIDLRDVVKLICLVYHEGRNVRHVIKSHKLVDASKYKRLTELPTNRQDAWRKMDKLRSCAVVSGSIDAATETFEREFGLSLADLATLYEMPIWKHSARGGNKWAHISSKIHDLVSAMQAHEGPSIAEALYREILSADHNTGRVADKLQKLELCCLTKP